MFHYNLDGWTGRYSMPLEFLLSTHIATMAPDLSYKLATEFNTDVEILLWKSKDNSLEGGVQQNSGDIVTYAQLYEIYNQNKNVSFLYGPLIGEIDKNKAAAEIFRAYPQLHSLKADGDENSPYYCTNDISCSDQIQTEGSQVNTTCQACADFVELLTRALKEIHDKNFDVFVPYVNSVTDHWFRNVYFTYGGMKQYAEDNGIEIPNTIVTDEEYYLTTGEMWTQYEKNAEGSDYELYVYLPNSKGDYSGKFAKSGTLVCRPGGPYSISEKAGNLYDKKGNGGYGLYTVSGSGQNKTYSEYDSSDVEEFRVGKKAMTKSQKEDWNAYNLDAERTGEDEWIQYEGGAEDEDEYIKEAKALKGIQLMYNLVTINGNITQKEDGVRGETNVETKKIFLDDYYLYDGSGPRAAAIEMAKNAVKLYTPNADYNDPDSFRALAKLGHFTEGRMQNIRYKGKSYEATIDDISGPINILQNSLTAFSILRNMHTLDSEYIYHDFKELMVELDYFDKEDLIESEREVMMFPISGISSAGWPAARYDKSEEFYGTLIHSAQDYETKRQETIEELAELFGEEIEDEEQEEAPAEPNPDAVTTDNLLVKAAADIMSYMQQNDYAYCQGGSYHSDPSSAHPGRSCYRAPSFEDSQQSGHNLIDCSGFVSWCLQEVGILSKGTLLSSSTIASATTLSEYYTSGFKSSYSEYNPGTILIYDGHVNIYAGNGMIYDAGSTSSMKNSPRNVSSGRPASSVRGYIEIPNNKMTYNGVTGIGGSVTMATFDGYEGGEAVLAPVTGEVIKYGTVKRKNLETGVEDEEVGFIKIRVLGNEEALPGSTCNYFGDDDKKKGYNYFWEEYVEAGITNHVLYIEGFDVSQVLGDNGDRNCSVSGPNIGKLRDYINASDSENNYSTKYQVPRLVDEKKMERLEKQEKAKKDAVYTIEQGDKIYVKEGAVIGHTYTQDKVNMVDGVGNYMRVIFRDVDDQVVENVENYMEIDENPSLIGNDYDVRADANQCVVTEEEFRQIFADKSNIVNNTDAFYNMQNTYNVSAVFAACVTIVESSGGESWAAIDRSTYNWTSVTTTASDPNAYHKEGSKYYWKRYNSFADALTSSNRGFGDYIANSEHYFNADKYKVSEIAPSYCGTAWGNSVNNHIKNRLERLNN